jgi:hypothetical protein
MQPILTPPIPFHTITIDFILRLPTSFDGYDCVMSVTDKFTKRVTFIPGKTTWKAKDWARALLAHLAQTADRMYQPIHTVTTRRQSLFFQSAIKPDEIYDILWGEMVRISYEYSVLPQ